MNDFNKKILFQSLENDFQENICQLMLEDRPFFDQITEVWTSTSLRRSICKSLLRP